MSVAYHFKQELLKDSKNIFKGIVSYFVEPKRRALFQYRLAKEWYDNGHRISSKFLQNKLLKHFGCDISMQATIGKNLRLRHVNGVVIGKDVKIGDNVIIYHQVTIGGKNLGDAELKKYPQIGNNVTIFTGAKLIGNIAVGDNAVIGANSVVNSDVDANSVYAGIPAKKIKTLDKNHIFKDEESESKT